MEPIKGAGSSIPANIVQEVLGSASNAAEKGISQFLTPVDFAMACAQALPSCRPTIVDLNVANGQLVTACANSSTTRLLGIDIDDCKWTAKPALNQRDLDLAVAIANNAEIKPDNGISHRKICGDLTLVYPLLVDAEWKADLFVLNPPFSLHWWRERLSALGESEVDAVKEAFKATDELTGKDKIDSTIATLMMALDRSTYCAEGFCIANNATLERLIFAQNAPYKPLERHIWARLIIPGNPMTQRKDCSFQHDTVFKTAVIYFARSHENGPQFTEEGDPAILAGKLARSRRDIRGWAGITGIYQTDRETVNSFSAVADEWKARQLPKRTDFNLWLNPSGTIGVQLSTFDTVSVKIDKQKARALYELKDKRPMSLVLQRQQRKELESAVVDSMWRVQPALLEAVRDAVRSYHSQRSPLYPLPEIQRLGFLDENDVLKCRKTFREFEAGKSYPLRSLTVKTTRNATRMNLCGQMEQIQYSGSELAFLIRGEDDTEHCFADARLLDSGVEIESYITVEYTLQQLVEFFEIPTVPDVSESQPEQYRKNLETLDKIMAAINS